MWFLQTFLFFCVVTLIAEAREKHECEVKFGVTDAEWEDMKKGTSGLSDKLACFMKCVMEKDGSLDNEGKLNIDKFMLGTDNWVKLTEKEKSKTTTCLKTVAPVKICSDVQPIYLCIVNSDK